MFSSCRKSLSFKIIVIVICFMGLTYVFAFKNILYVEATECKQL